MGDQITRKVTYFPLQAHCFAFGGFEVQMLSAFKAVKNFGYDGLSLSKVDVWSRIADFDVAHFWGLEIDNFSNLIWAKKSGKKVVLTALFGYYETFLLKAKNFASRYLHAGRFRLEMLKYVDILVVVSDEQKILANKYYGFSEDRIIVIPNIVSNEFMTLTKRVLPLGLPFQQYVLCVGNVCQRKNQEILIDAVVKLGLNLVLVGKPIAGERSYVSRVEEKVNLNKNIIWIEGLREGSEELVSLVQNCSVFALPSFSETQPISMLEAAFCAKPLLTGNRAYAKQKFYQNAMLVNPNSLSAIQIGLESVVRDPIKYVSPSIYLTECTEEAVGQAYSNIYLSI
ncbi:glycosyltransferase family 4 protein [Pedobacter sp. GR22-6]|uniref:glycosyltransferase family 4 protein n=1 Tax=Pedobacter sp. GR22-6 TaxID=3127957 RepID=UPI00307F0CD5